MRNKKLQVWLPLVFSLVMIAGMFFGFKLHQQTGSAGSFFKREKRGALQEALDLIQNRYVDSVRMDSLQDGAMEGIMDHLDPHSFYIPASDVSATNEDIIGNFQVIANGTMDSVEECDGADVINLNLGPAFPMGLLVVQDGDDDPKVLEEDDGELENIATSFKFVPWENIAQAFPTPCCVAALRRGEIDLA